MIDQGRLPSSIMIPESTKRKGRDETEDLVNFAPNDSNLIHYLNVNERGDFLTMYRSFKVRLGPPGGDLPPTFGQRRGGGGCCDIFCQLFIQLPLRLVKENLNHDPARRLRPERDSSPCNTNPHPLTLLLLNHPPHTHTECFSCSGCW